MKQCDIEKKDSRQKGQKHSGSLRNKVADLSSSQMSHHVDNSNVNMDVMSEPAANLSSTNEETRKL